MDLFNEENTIEIIAVEAFVSNTKSSGFA